VSGKFGINASNAARISEYERGAREPSMITVLAYADAGKVNMDFIVDDTIVIDAFRELLGKHKRQKLVTRIGE
jgi:transcriptional regulator with XRE-family HTH domain